jgi:hypothetical protein
LSRANPIRNSNASGLDDIKRASITTHLTPFATMGVAIGRVAKTLISAEMRHHTAQAFGPVAGTEHIAGLRDAEDDDLLTFGGRNRAAQ